MSKKGQMICYGVVGAIGVILIIVSMAGFAYFPPLIQDQVFKNLDLTDSESEGFKNFMAPPVPLYMAFNMYNVTNPNEIIKGEKPILKEVGPFVYRETRQKQDLNQSSDGCSIKASQYKMYEFDVEKTNELCPDCGDARKTSLKMINAAYVGILQFVREGFTKDLAENPCQPDPLGCLNDQVKDNIDRISCVVEKQKWSDTLLQIGKEATYPACEIGTIDDKWEKYTDTLFIDVLVDDFLFQGYESGVIRLMQEQLIEHWGLNDTVSTDMQFISAAFNWPYPLVRLPSVIQPGEDGAYRFAALNTKNSTTHNEYYEIDTGKCGRRSNDNWWILNPDDADNEMINYMQIKQWAPEEGRLNNFITPDVLCKPGEQDCFENPLEGNPYVDFGWWTQNNGFQCFENHNYTRDFCFDSNGTMMAHNNICNWPRGTDGQQFHPYIEKDERLFIFQTDICRSLYMNYKEDTTFMDVETYKFVVPKEALSVTTEYNLGYCKEVQRGIIEKVTMENGTVYQTLHTVDWDSCVQYVSFNENPEDSVINITACKQEKGYDMSHDCKDGILDISKCMEGAAVTISSPHFYQSDPALWQMFDGISDPELTPEAYETYMLVEPYTGAALSLHKRLQFNIPLHKDSHSAYMTNLWEDHSLFPMFWIEEFADLNEDYKETLDKMLIKPLKIIDGVQWTMFAVGVVMVIVAVVMFAIKCCKD